MFKMVFDDWQKKKVIGKIIKQKDYKTYKQLFIFKMFTKKTELIFVFDIAAKKYIDGLDANNHFVFYVDDKKAKNNKIYNTLKNQDYIQKIGLHEIRLAQSIYLRNKLKTEKSTWAEDMKRVDAIVAECAASVANYKKEQEKKYWYVEEENDFF